MKVVEFFLDIYSPYAYLAAHRLLELEKSQGIKISYIPVKLVRIKRAAGNTGPANIEIPPKIKYLMKDLERWTEKYELPLQLIQGPESDRINKGVFYAIKQGVAGQYLTEAYKLVWGVGGNPDDDDLLKTVASNMKFDVDLFMSFLDSAEADALYEVSNCEAINRGVFGVPTMIYDDMMWWGNDRISFLEEHLQKNK